MEGIAIPSGSESAAEKVGLRWEVGPTEDVVQALMETLVDPILPLRISSIPPSEDIQIAVAKQMHAVVLLYNYHHRKQKSELVFLEFVNFCKLAIVIRPPLIKFMKLMKGRTLQELNGNEDQLSVTEKAIKDACNISLSLDASRDVPNMEGWPISKVAVLLIDSKKENCMLQFDTVTEGAWSLIEKGLSECESSSITPEISAGDKVGNKRKRDNLKVSTYYTEFLQLGYDVVKDVTGISISDLEVLETHMTYSLSKEKSIACFYIMQCPGSFNERNQVPLKFLAESVQGPLAEKFANGSWKTTPLVKLYHMLPYMELILCWLSGCKMEVNSSDQKVSPVDIFHEKDSNLKNKFVKRFDFLDSTESNQNGILENLADGSEQADKCLSSSPSRGLSEMVIEVDNAMEEFGKGCDMADPPAIVASRITLENPDTESNDPVSGLSKGLFGKTVVVDSVREKFNEKHDVGHSAGKDEGRSLGNLTDESEQADKYLSSGPSRGQCEMVMNVDNAMEEFEKECDMADPTTELASRTTLENPDTESDDPVSGLSKGLFGKTVVDDSVRDKFNEKHDVGHSTEKDEGRSLENLTDESEQADKCLSSGPSRGQCEMVMKVDNAMEKFEKECDMADPTTELASRITLENPDTESDDPVSGLSKGLFGKTVVDDSVREKFNENHDVGHSAEKDEGRICPEKLDEDGVGCGKDIFSGPPRVLETTNINNSTEICTDTDNKMPKTTIKVYHHRRKKNSSLKNVTQLKEDVPGLKVDMVEALESNHTQRKDEKLSGDEGCLTNTCNQTGTASTRDQQAQIEAKTKANIEVQSASDSFRLNYTGRQDEKVTGDESDLTQECNHTGIAFAATRNHLAQVEAKSKHDLGVNTTSGSDHLQNALALLYRKRREVYSQICYMEDALALCEDNVARIRDGGEVDLARQCIESVVSGKFDSLMENGTQVQNKDSQQDENCKSQHGKPTKLSEVYLAGLSSCQDLEYTCVRNNWRMPRYLTESSDGKFLSNVVVEGKDFKLHAKGGLQSNPCKARETAAAQMITVMHTTFL